MRLRSLFSLALLLGAGVNLHAQRGQAARGPALPPRQAAPIDLTGYWVSIVSEDWRVRMTMGQKGDWQFLPLNPQGRAVAEAANPAKEDPCMAYGAAGLLRVPGRLHISWVDDATLRIEADAGTQVRDFRFNQAAPPSTPPSRQGFSTAEWEARSPVPDVSAKKAPGGELRVITTHMEAGYYFKHGVPYSGNATMTEYFARISEQSGDYLLVTTIVEDPQNLTQPYLKTLTFKKEPDSSKFRPSACSVP